MIITIITDLQPFQIRFDNLSSFYQNFLGRRIVFGRQSFHRRIRRRQVFVTSNVVGSGAVVDCEAVQSRCNLIHNSDNQLEKKKKSDKM
jgi:hypothetical protein